MSIADKLAAIAENVQKVYDAGKAAGGDGDGWYDIFWDVYQDNGARTDYQYAFRGIGWTDETFAPKHTIQPYRAQYMFAESKIQTSEYLSKLDFSKSSAVTQIFMSSTVEELGVVDFGAVTTGWGGVNQTFHYCSKLRKIGLFIPPRDKTAKIDCFYGCSALTDIQFGGTIYVSLSFSSSPLTVDSIKSTIEWLNDYAETGTSVTLTLGATNLAKLTDEEKAVATQKGWTLV